MEVHFAPELQAEIDRLVIETGRAPGELIEDAMAGYVAELAATRQMLDNRCDDLPLPAKSASLTSTRGS